MRKNNQKVLVDWHKVHAKYLSGKTLTELAKELKCSYQCISNNFKRRNLKIMTLSESILRSSKIKRGTTGRTRPLIKINKKRHQLSHYNCCIANHFLTIPKGCVIHHKDNNRHNNDAENLVLLPADLHKSMHSKIMQGGN